MGMIFDAPFRRSIYVSGATAAAFKREEARVQWNCSFFSQSTEEVEMTNARCCTILEATHGCQD